MATTVRVVCQHVKASGKRTELLSNSSSKDGLTSFKFTSLQHLKMPDFIYCYWVINAIHYWKVIKQYSKISGCTDTMQSEMLKQRECEQSRPSKKFVRCKTQQTETVLAVLSLLVTNPENYKYIKS